MNIKFLLTNEQYLIKLYFIFWNFSRNTCGVKMQKKVDLNTYSKTINESTKNNSQWIYLPQMNEKWSTYIQFFFRSDELC